MYLLTSAFPLFAASDPALTKALDYLAREVESWRPNNGCFSCHNNGDGARALLAAGAAPESIKQTLEFLSNPDSWDPKPLARVQFASALARTPNAKALARAAELIAADQLADGHWKVDEESGPGAAATYGPVLGTVVAMRLLTQADAAHYAEPIRRARAWLESRKAEHPLDLAALVWELQRPADITRLQAMQAPNGSWNSEAFDTAVASLALGGNARALAYLRKTQLAPGGWPGTTRPAGGASYAQHISTTAWVVLALSEK